MRKHMIEKPIIKQPLYSQVSDYVINKINEGDYLVDEALPSEWDLAKKLKVSQGTVRKALTQLVQQGVLYRHQGVGTFVKAAITDWGVLPIFSDSGIPLSKEPLKQEILGLNKGFASEAIAAYFGLRRRQSVWHLTSIWRQHANIIALDQAYLPFELFEYLTVRQIKESNGVYPFLLIKQGIHAQIVTEQISLSRLSHEEAQLLQRVPSEMAMLTIRHTQDYSKTPIEWRRRVLVDQHFSIQINY